MPAFDRIWRLFPLGVAGVGERDVWVRPTERSALATVGEQLDLAGRLVNPLSTIVVRMRYTTQVVLDSRFRDPDGRSWRVGEVREVGRRRYLDVVCSTYDTLLIPNTAAFNPPTGWFLQVRREGGADQFQTTGTYVSQLTVRVTQESNNQRLFDVLIPSPGWAVARGLPQWIGNGAIPIIAINGQKPTSVFGQPPAEGQPDNRRGNISVPVADARLTGNNNYDSGVAFPTYEGGAFWLRPAGFAVPSLVAGDVITIAPAAS